MDMLALLCDHDRMDTVKILPAGSIGRQFVPAEFIPAGDNEFTIRNQQFSHSDRAWRPLEQHEREALAANGNTAERWDEIQVTDTFDPQWILNSTFRGFVRIGAVENLVLEHHDLRVPVGITNCQIISSDIGDHVAIHNVRYLAHYIVGDRSIITNVDEMHTTNHAKFGNGIIKDGEDESIRVTLDLINEAGTRAVCAFEGMLPGDAYLWTRYRGDAALQAALKEFTQLRYDSRRGYYGTVGAQSVIKNCGIVKDARIGSHCYIKGANKLKNLTIDSSVDEPTQIGEGVELVNGIVGRGSRVFYGSKAVRFVLGSNCELKYGARLIHSYMGDNSTVSCCELLNNLIFPAHEQHHNNSFLVASLVMGQSNIAAGATIGSNHNSRSNDSEIQAGRGFWPGLTTSLKHSSRFASFVLISKGAFPAELDIRLPFSLVSNNVSEDRLEIMPAFWWLYNMYALARNSWKFKARDARVEKKQNIEFDALAPDTVEEIILARELLEIWTGMAAEPADARHATRSSREHASIGRRLLTGLPGELDSLTVLGQDVEKTHRDVVILKPREAYEAYGQMLHYYAAQNLLSYLEEHPEQDYAEMCKRLDGSRAIEWVNLGGQLAPEEDVDALRLDIRSGVLPSWDAVHERYDQLWERYPLQKQRHAYAVSTILSGSHAPDLPQWRAFLDQALAIQELVRDRVYSSRAKDYANPFRRATYRNEQEMIAALGTIDDNSFVRQVRAETEEFALRVESVRERG